MPIKRTLRDPFFWLFAGLYAVAFVVTGNMTDDDSAATKDIGVSAYLLWAKLIATLSATQVVPVLYGFGIAAALAASLRARNWPAVLFFFNPFVVTNICDVFNRFTLSLALAGIAASALHRAKSLTAICASGALATLHPINLIFLLYALSPAAASFIPVFLSAVQTLVPLDVFEQLFPDKVELYRQFGDNIALYSGGNFQIAPEVLMDGGFLMRFFAAALPGFSSTNEAWWLPFVAAYIAFWYTAIFLLMRNRLACALLALATLTTLSYVVGNSAVIARHFLPLFYFSIQLFSKPFAGNAASFGIASIWGAESRWTAGRYKRQPHQPTYHLQ